MTKAQHTSITFLLSILFHVTIVNSSSCRAALRLGSCLGGLVGCYTAGRYYHSQFRKPRIEEWVHVGYPMRKPVIQMDPVYAWTFHLDKSAESPVESVHVLEKRGSDSIVREFLLPKDAAKVEVRFTNDNDKDDVDDSSYSDRKLTITLEPRSETFLFSSDRIIIDFHPSKYPEKCTKVSVSNGE